MARFGRSAVERVRAIEEFGQRLAGSALVGALAFVVAAPMAVAVRYTYDTASLLGSVFGSVTGGSGGAQRLCALL